MCRRAQIFGREVQTPRYQQSYGRAYRFSGIELFGGPVPDAVAPLLEWANSMPEVGGCGHRKHCTAWPSRGGRRKVDS